MRFPPGIPWGEIGGIFAGVVALLATIGAGIKWLLNWNEARAETRRAKLEAWHKELADRERKFEERQEAFYAQLDRRVDELEGQNQALRLAFELVAARVRMIDPDDSDLKKAEQLLQAAFPLIPKIPADMSAKLGKLD